MERRHEIGLFLSTAVSRKRLQAQVGSNFLVVGHDQELGLAATLVLGRAYDLVVLQRI